MTENEINITDMIKALQCIASQDADGDCYCDHFNAHLTFEQFGDNARLDEKHMSCGGIIKDTQSCPYSQKTYGVCFEDGELWWLKDIADMLTEIQQYRELGTVEEILKVFNNQREIISMQHETVKQYRAIGTVEGYKIAIESSIGNYNLYKKYKAKIQEFEAIGTVEEFKALKEKNEPKKPQEISWGATKCPICGQYFGFDSHINHCSNCGQRLDFQ